MPGIGEHLLFGIGQRLLEHLEKMSVEHEILKSPTDEDRQIVVLVQLLAGRFHQRPCRVLR